MALRVLLADESTTIKKVIQLALQDFGVEVKSIPIGSDAELVAKQFKPDIVFADVLLAKKNGYEIAQLFKNSESLKAIPIILMWSGFIAFDEDRFVQCQANDRIEKPFDAETLRSMVTRHVPRLQQNALAPFLKYDLPEWIESPPASMTSTDTPPPPPPSAKNSKSNRTATIPALVQNSTSDRPLVESLLVDTTETLEPSPASILEFPEGLATTSLEPVTDAPNGLDWQPLELGNQDLEDLDDFQQVPLAKKNHTVTSTDSISMEDLTHTLPIYQDSIEEEPIEQAQITLMTENLSSVNLNNFDQALPETPLNKSALGIQPLAAAMDPLRLEELLREQVREVLQDMAWKLLPDIAERVVREEIAKLLKEAERLT